MMSGVASSTNSRPVHDREIETAPPVLGPHRHVVAQVVEAGSLFVPYVMSQAYCSRAARQLHVLLDAAHGQAEELVDLAHPLGVAAGQVVVDRDQVDAPAGERVQVERQRRLSVLPSPVYISAILPSWSMTPPINRTS
jgi:hypothetical protein